MERCVEECSDKSWLLSPLLWLHWILECLWMSIYVLDIECWSTFRPFSNFLTCWLRGRSILESRWACLARTLRDTEGYLWSGIERYLQPVRHYLGLQSTSPSIWNIVRVQVPFKLVWRELHDGICTGGPPDLQAVFARGYVRREKLSSARGKIRTSLDIPNRNVLIRCIGSSEYSEISRFHVGPKSVQVDPAHCYGTRATQSSQNKKYPTMA